MSPRPRPPDGEAPERAGPVADRRPSRRPERGLAIHARSRPPNAVPVTTRKRSIAQPGDGEVALDAAARVEQLGVRDRPDAAVDVVGREATEQVERARADDLELGERRFVEEPGGAPGRQVLRDDGRRPVLAGPAARPQRSWAGSSLLRYQLTRSQPDFSPKTAPSRSMTGVGRWQAQRPTGGALVVGVGDVVVRRVHLVRAGQAVAAGAVVRPEATDVHPPEVDRAVRHRRSTRRSPSRCRRLRRCRGRRSRPPRRTRPRRSRRG